MTTTELRLPEETLDKIAERAQATLAKYPKGMTVYVWAADLLELIDEVRAGRAMDEREDAA